MITYESETYNKKWLDLEYGSKYGAVARRILLTSQSSIPSKEIEHIAIIVHEAMKKYKNVILTEVKKNRNRTHSINLCYIYENTIQSELEEEIRNNLLNILTDVYDCDYEFFTVNFNAYQKPKEYYSDGFCKTEHIYSKYFGFSGHTTKIE